MCAARGGSTRAPGRGAKERFLHYNFVCALLNDLFGVQARGGCQCAGPYAQRLLGLNEAQARSFERVLLESEVKVGEEDDGSAARGGSEAHSEHLRPGFTAVNPYFTSAAEVEYCALRAVGRALWLAVVALYYFNYKTVSGSTLRASRGSVTAAGFRAGSSNWSATQVRCRTWRVLSSGSKGKKIGMNGDGKKTAKGELVPWMTRAFADADDVADAPARAAYAPTLADQELAVEGREAELRWVVFPSEAAEALRAGRSDDSFRSRDTAGDAGEGQRDNDSGDVLCEGPICPRPYAAKPVVALTAGDVPKAADALVKEQTQAQISPPEAPLPPQPLSQSQAKSQVKLKYPAALCRAAVEDPAPPTLETLRKVRGVATALATAPSQLPPAEVTQNDGEGVENDKSAPVRTGHQLGRVQKSILRAKRGQEAEVERRSLTALSDASTKANEVHWPSDMRVEHDQ